MVGGVCGLRVNVVGGGLVENIDDERGVVLGQTHIILVLAAGITVDEAPVGRRDVCLQGRVEDVLQGNNRSSGGGGFPFHQGVPLAVTT